MRTVLVLGLGFWLLAGVTPRSQTPAPQDAPTFKSQSELVLLHVVVRDNRRAYLAGLPAEAFLVYDNDRPQPIRFFLDEDAPVTLGLVVDSSGSMQPNRALMLAAAQSFVETSNPVDEIFALAFNERVRPALSSAMPFTNDAAVLRRALGTIPAYGRTALYDAIVSGLRYVERGRHERKVLVIVSDGADNASSADYAEVVARVHASNVVVYAVALRDPLESDSTPRKLKELAESTGGEAFTPDDPKEVSRDLKRIAEDIRHAYVVAYAPSDDTRDGRLRRVRVSVRSPDGRRVAVRTRAAYMSGRAEGEP